MGRQLVQTNQELPRNRPSPSYRGYSAAEELLRGPVHTLQEALVHHGLFFPASRLWIARLLQTLGVFSNKMYTLYAEYVASKREAKESWTLAWVSNSPG